jgi:hypothetical protein
LFSVISRVSYPLLQSTSNESQVIEQGFSLGLTRLFAAQETLAH